MATASRKTLILSLSIVIAVLVVLGFWLYGKRKAPEQVPSKSLHTGVGEVMAQETIQCVGGSGDIVLVTLEEGVSSEMDTQVDAFKDLIYDTPIKIRRTDSISADKTDGTPGHGMSAKRLLRLVQKYPDAKAFVSFVGLPDADEEELKQLSAPVPLVAFTKSSKDVNDLLKRKLLQVAIVPRFQFPAPGPEKPKTNREWFDKQFQVVRQAGTDQAQR